MLSEGSSIAEVDREIALIYAQKGYVLHLQGLNAQAKEMYNKAASGGYVILILVAKMLS
jgi:hypothetical protein